jgi:hypothetical protein
MNSLGYSHWCKTAPYADLSLHHHVLDDWTQLSVRLSILADEIDADSRYGTSWCLLVCSDVSLSYYTVACRKSVIQDQQVLRCFDGTLSCCLKEAGCRSRFTVTEVQLG